MISHRTAAASANALVLALFTIVPAQAAVSAPGTHSNATSGVEVSVGYGGNSPRGYGYRDKVNSQPVTYVRRCFDKKLHVWNPYRDTYEWAYKTVCYRED